MFRNREEAGRLLADKLQQYAGVEKGLILALPRGGVAVGYQVSLGLRLPLDVFLTRKIGAPGNPEYAVGAIAETGYLHVNESALAYLKMSHQALAELASRERPEIIRREAQYRQGRPLPVLTDRAVILVDDGIATGATFLASVEAIRTLKPRRLIGALPVGPADTVQNVRLRVDELVVLMTPDTFFAVGDFYMDFTQVEDRDVIQYLNLADEATRERALFHTDPDGPSHKRM